MAEDLGFYSERKGGKLFCINAVTGPDEYNAVVNNNALANLMARENLHYAAQTVSSMRVANADAYDRLVRETALEPTEAEAWRRAAENMYVPYDETLQIIPQDDSFLEKEPWDFTNTPSDHYPLLLFHHPLDIYRKQVIKQADVVMAMFLLGPSFSLEDKRRNFEFYNAFTTGDSSLSVMRRSQLYEQRKPADVDRAISIRHGRRCSWIWPRRMASNDESPVVNAL